MEKNIVDVVSRFDKLCLGLKDGRVQIKDIPFDTIFNILSYAYGIAGENSEEYVALYGEMLISGVEKRDIDILVNIIKLAMRHLVLLSSVKKGYDAEELKRFRLQCQNAYCRNRERLGKWESHHCAGEKGIPFVGKGVVYSAVTGGYDGIKDPLYVDPEWDYILFTDDPDIRSDVWRIKVIENPDGLDSVRLARRIKILGHRYLRDYDYSVWVDGKVQITGDFREFILSNRGKQPMLCFNHYIHDCIYSERNLCLALKKDDPKIMDSQIDRYRREGYPEHFGLIDSAILIRELRNDRVIRLMETWWNEVSAGSRRDQLSFNYACWRNDFVYDSTELFLYRNKYVEVFEHG